MNFAPIADPGPIVDPGPVVDDVYMTMEDDKFRELLAKTLGSRCREAETSPEALEPATRRRRFDATEAGGLDLSADEA